MSKKTVEEDRDVKKTVEEDEDGHVFHHVFIPGGRSPPAIDR